MSVLWKSSAHKKQLPFLFRLRKFSKQPLMRSCGMSERKDKIENLQPPLTPRALLEILPGHPVKCSLLSARNQEKLRHGKALEMWASAAFLLTAMLSLTVADDFATLKTGLFEIKFTDKWVIDCKKLIIRWWFQIAYICCILDENQKNKINRKRSVPQHLFFL